MCLGSALHVRGGGVRSAVIPNKDLFRILFSRLFARQPPPRFFHPSSGRNHARVATFLDFKEEYICLFVGDSVHACGVLFCKNDVSFCFWRQIIESYSGFLCRRVCELPRLLNYVPFRISFASLFARQPPPHFPPIFRRSLCYSIFRILGKMAKF